MSRLTASMDIFTVAVTLTGHVQADISLEARQPLQRDGASVEHLSESGWYHGRFPCNNSFAYVSSQTDFFSNGEILQMDRGQPGSPECIEASRGRFSLLVRSTAGGQGILLEFVTPTVGVGVSVF